MIKTVACSVLSACTASVVELESILNHSESKVLFVSNYKILKKLTDVINSNNYLQAIIVMFEKGNRPEDINKALYTYDEIIEKGKNHQFSTPEMNLSDNAIMLYTSGTTGFPKGVVISHGNFLSQMLPLEEGLQIKKGETSIQVLPVWHAYELTTQTNMFITGLHLHFTSIAHLKDDLVKHDIDIFMSVPRIWEALRLGVYHKLKQQSQLTYFIFDLAVKNSIRYKLHKMYSEKRITNKQSPYNILVNIYHNVVRSFRKPIHLWSEKNIYKK